MQSQHIIEGFRLSPQQKRLWSFQEDTYGASHRGHVYRSHCAMLLDGLLKVNKLQAAVDRAVACHEVYRTCLRRVPGVKVPRQVVTERCLFTWQQVNLCDYDPEEQKQHPINLEYGPLLHFSLVNIADHKHVLWVHLSALHADRRSMENLMRKIAQEYGKDYERHELSDADGMVQYSQFSEWQNALLDEEEGRSDQHGFAPNGWACRDGREYWRRQGLSLLSDWSLPYEDKSNGGEVFMPDAFAVPVADDLRTRLSLLAKRYDTSAAHFLLACWHVLLWRLTGQEWSLIGMGADGRVVEGLAETAGLLTKYIPIGCRLSGDRSFSEVLIQVKQTADEVHKWQHYFTWDDVRQADGGTVGSPSFPFSFDFSHWPAAFVADGISFSLRECHAYVEPFKVRVSVIQKADGALVLEFHYNTSLFGVSAVRRLAEQYCMLVQRALEEPEGGVDSF